MTNQKQIARDLGISVATVSNALTGRGRVSADVVDLVTKRAEQIGYVPSSAGRALKTGRSGILGLVIPDITQQAFPQFAKGMEAMADAAGFGVLVANARATPDGQKRAIRQLIQRGVDGIVVIPRRSTTVDLECAVPMAVVSTQGDPANTVSANHRQGGALAAQTLLDLGHRKFLLLGEDKASQVQTDRIEGMEGCLKGRATAEFSIVWTQDMFPDLAAHHEKGVTAILTVSDLLALRVVTQAAQLGIRCPQDISVIGFDDLPVATAMRPMLSTIAPDVSEIARRAIAHLVDAIGKPDQPGAAPHSRANLENAPETVPPSHPDADTVAMSLVMRESAGPAKHSP